MHRYRPRNGLIRRWETPVCRKRCAGAGSPSWSGIKLGAVGDACGAVLSEPGKEGEVNQFFPLIKFLLGQTAGEILFDEGNASRGVHPPFARQHGTPPGEFCAKIRSDSPRTKTWFTGWVHTMHKLASGPF